MAFTTDRSSFSQVTGNKAYKCSGCGEAIPRGSQHYEKPFNAYGKPKGFTRLHNLEDCWETWDEDVIKVLIAKRAERGSVSRF